MNQQQKEAYESIISGKNVFITGGGGVGKTFVIQQFVNNYKHTKKIALTSTTGVSSLLVGGSTLHSLLGIGLGRGTINSIIKHINKTNRKNTWTDIDVLIIDEVSMLDPELFDKLENIARKIRKTDIKFGGIQLILSGDFCQLPCVNKDEFCFESKTWESCIDKIYYLTEIVRQKDKTFSEILNDIRIGNITDNVKKVLNSRVISCKNSDIKPTILYPDNRNVDLINNIQLNKLVKDNGFVYEYESDFSDSNIKQSVNYSVKLTTNCQVMLTYNMDIMRGLVNGSRGVIVGFTEEDTLPIVKFLELTCVIDYKQFDVEENGKIKYSYTFMPLKLAWAITIHKSQGMTLDFVETDLRNIFEYGQGYVCLSRLKSLEGLFLKGIDYRLLQCNPKAIKFYDKLIKK